MKKLWRALGMMSGTSLDGVDVAWLETDGRAFVRPGAYRFYPYAPEVRAKLRGCFGRKDRAGDLLLAEGEALLTHVHAQAFHAFCADTGIEAEALDLIGFHGQTVWHNPSARETVQLGDGEMLAAKTGVTVVNDFRSADVGAGGQGAPLVPLYHRALASAHPRPTILINIGGVSNLTWIGGEEDETLLAFDLGPGGAMIDDWVLRHTGKAFDKDGALAAKGRVHHGWVERLMEDPFFAVRPPKSLDRDAFAAFVPNGLSVADGAATLTMMTARAVVEGLAHLPSTGRALYLTGGGRANATLRRFIAELSGLEVLPVEALGWSGDAMEAEAFAYLAVRAALKLPLSLPSTTRVPAPLTGGTLYDPPEACKSQGREKRAASV